MESNIFLTGTDAWQWFGTLSVALNGRLAVVWNDTRNSGPINLSEFYYAYSTDAADLALLLGAWGPCP